MKKKIHIHIVIQILLFFALIAVDQLTKIAATNALKDNDANVLIDGVLEFRYLENTGAAFNIFQNRQWLFYIITAIVLVLIILLWGRVVRSLNNYTSLTDSFKQKTFNNGILLNYILVILAAGAVGNLIDRIRFHYVVDFIYVRLINFPIFNFADICVTISAILLAVFFIFIYKEDPNFPVIGGGKKEEKASK